MYTAKLSQTLPSLNDLTDQSDAENTEQKPSDEAFEDCHVACKSLKGILSKTEVREGIEARGEGIEQVNEYAVKAIGAIKTVKAEVAIAF